MYLGLLSKINFKFFSDYFTFLLIELVSLIFKIFYGFFPCSFQNELRTSTCFDLVVFDWLFYIFFSIYILYFTSSVTGVFHGGSVWAFPWISVPPCGAELVGTRALPHVLCPHVTTATDRDGESIQWTCRRIKTTGPGQCEVKAVNRDIMLC